MKRIAAMIRTIRVLNKHVSRDELDSILEDLEETLRGERSSPALSVASWVPTARTMNQPSSC